MNIIKKMKSLLQAQPMTAAVLAVLILIFTGCTGCKTSPFNFASGDLAVEIEPGEHWIHEMPLFLFIHIKSPPQFAIWIETSDEEYLDTLYVTEKTAKQKWLKAPEDDTPKTYIRRPESLPFWSHKRGVVYDDGLYMPTADDPLPDTVSGATPKEAFALGLDTGTLPEQFILRVEVNASLDFNDAYPADAPAAAENYSGGEWGSGQPALVYSALIDTSASHAEWQLTLAGHSSPDGSDGELYRDTGTLTTAASIVEQITVRVLQGN